MRTLLVVIGTALVLLIAGYAAAKVTVGHRSSTARDRLEKAASRFVACHKQDASYVRCSARTSKLAVTYRRRNAFALSSAVEFGPTYTISRMGNGELERTCQPRGTGCPTGNWRTDGP